MQNCEHALIPAGDEALLLRGETTLLLVDAQRIWLKPDFESDYPECGAGHPCSREARERTILQASRLLAASVRPGAGRRMGAVRRAWPNSFSRSVPTAYHRS